jgi:hypothetical protein
MDRSTGGIIAKTASGDADMEFAFVTATALR